MGQKRKEKPEDGYPMCRHAKTKVWFREKKGNNAQTQTYTTPWGSSGSDCSSSKWYDPSTTSATECHRFDSADERSDYGDISKSCCNPKCESRGSGSRSTSCHERRIYLHLNLKDRESPQLVVCPKRNHCQLQHSTSHETVIDVDDSELLPRPSWPPSRPPSRPRSRLSEPSLSMISSSSNFSPRGRIGHQGSYSKVSLQDPSQLQSLRQSYQGSGSRSSSEKPPSPTASNLTPRRMRASLHNVDRNLAHERAMSATPRSNELDLRFNSAFRRNDDEHRDLNAQSQMNPGVGGFEAQCAARSGCVGETSLALPKCPHGQQMHVNSKILPEPDCMVKVATPRSSSIKMKNDLPLRVKGGSDSPHNEPEEDFAESSTPPQTEGVVLSWEGLTVRSKVGKVLLDNLNGQITSGFTAIMGPSGSGKSTLLNTLACRMGQSASIEGRILLNGRHYKIADLKKMSGYVMQDDLLNAHLTVEETLKYTTRLKLEPSLTEEEVYSRVNHIIKQMGLDHVRDTVIGSPDKRGISGGERKRVCVGMELLTHPELLFLDEPTSGLDSVTALSLCEQLEKLASTGHCTIVCTIHQPQAKIFNLFHFLIILKAGQVIYQGKASEVLRFFEESGFPCPEYTNPADHFLDVITPSIDKARDSYRQIDDVLKSKFQALPVNMSQGSEYLVLQTTRERMPWHRQYIVLLNRGIREQSSTPSRENESLPCVKGQLECITAHPISWRRLQRRWPPRSFRPSYSRALFIGWLASREMAPSL
ncbi:hypothetical protein M758_7G114400 [Ceratodon purpureus]|nr:hypothetical protein M758_7G114400 [Ceratodon purpureus]